MFREGEWIIDKVHGLLGTVLRVFPDGVTARFGEMTAIRKNENVELASMDIYQEDLLAMQHLAVETGDENWFRELSEKMGVKMGG